MRGLTKKQKGLLIKWFNENYKGGYMFDLADKIDYKEYSRIEQLNKTEVFYQEANNFLEGLVRDR